MLCAFFLGTSSYPVLYNWILVDPSGPIPSGPPKIFRHAWLAPRPEWSDSSWSVAPKHFGIKIWMFHECPAMIPRWQCLMFAVNARSNDFLVVSPRGVSRCLILRWMRQTFIHWRLCISQQRKEVQISIFVTISDLSENQRKLSVKLESLKDYKTKQVTFTDLPSQGYRCCRYLVKAQADVKQKAWHCASFAGHGLVMKCRMGRVCSPKLGLSKDSSKRTPLDAAMEGGSNLAFTKTIQKLQSCKQNCFKIMDIDFWFIQKNINKCRDSQGHSTA